MSADNWCECPWCGDSDSWREDYEMGMSDGEFSVGYHGRCIHCLKVFTHKHAEIVVPDVKKRKAERKIAAVKEEMDKLQRIIDGQS